VKQCLPAVVCLGYSIAEVYLLPAASGLLSLGCLSVLLLASIPRPREHPQHIWNQPAAIWPFRLLGRGCGVDEAPFPSFVCCTASSPTLHEPGSNFLRPCHSTLGLGSRGARWSGVYPPACLRRSFHPSSAGQRHPCHWDPHLFGLARRLCQTHLSHSFVDPKHLRCASPRPPFCRLVALHDTATIRRTLQSRMDGARAGHFLLGPAVLPVHTLIPNRALKLRGTFGSSFHAACVASFVPLYSPAE